MALVTFIFLGFFGLLFLFINYIIYKKWKPLIVASYLFALLFILLLGYILYGSIHNLEVTKDYTKLGQTGDYIGGLLNPFISVFAVIAAGFAFYAQYQANKQVQEQFVKQEVKDYRQNFESTFFNMLTIHHDIVKNIDFNTNSFYENSDKLQLYVSEHNNALFKSTFPIKKKFNSRDVFKVSLDFLRYLIQEDLILEHQLNRPNENQIFMSLYDSQLGKKINVFRQIFNSSNIRFIGITENTRFQSIYDHVYSNLSTDYGHYFRNLYRIIKMVDEKKFSDNQVEDYKIKYSYTSIVRSQLSDDEIVWLFFNCLSNFGNVKFKPLIEKYTILKIINRDNDVYNFYTKFYEDTAFVKPNDDKLEEHINKFNKYFNKVDS